eukprot:TRINITY_DN36829_c0_g1_i1.p1 TRINITY_DN36829_c0_g1~~TRINITY_DN36829_c0_g1_i1.p1  ORF type:complete len:1780 (-),score=395.79 TRINITY_DN36829_c0_g1_i1:42-5381(-)
MDLTVLGAKGLPQKAYLSLRAGDVRKQIQYKPGECFRFDAKNVPRNVVVDVFEKVGSAQVSMVDLASSPEGGSVHLPGRDGSPIVLDMQVKVRPQHTVPEGTKKPRLSRHQAALEAQTYLEAHSVQKVLQGMVHELLTTQPPDPLSFMTKYIEDHRIKGKAEKNVPPAAVIKPRDSEAESDSDDELEALPNWASLPGLGENEYPGFPGDGSQPLPDLSKHSTILASVLKEEPSCYESSKDVRTPSGVSLAQCVKPGIDNKGSPMIRTLGLVAGDDACYDVFGDFFFKVKERWHSSGLCDACIDDVMEAESKVISPIDPLGQSVLSVKVTCCRNLRGLRFPAAAQLEDRREAERILVGALLSLDMLAEGEYHPLRGSTSYAPKPQGMSATTEHTLKTAGVLLTEPQSALPLSSGLGRQWPDARGVFTDGKGLFAWLNEADHLRLEYKESGSDLLKAMQRIQEVEQALSGCIEASGHHFAKSKRFGFLTTCPTNAGAGVQASAMLCLPQLASNGSELKALCRRLGLNPVRQRSCHEDGTSKGIWEVTVARRMGVTGEGVVGVLASGCRQLVSEELKKKAALATAGLSNGAMGGEFPRDACPEKMPDVSKRHSLAARVLRDDPSIYGRLKDAVTPLGVSFATCIKTCFDTFGHPMLKTVGAVAGDAASYSIFKDLFDPIIRLRHPGYSENRPHRTDLDCMKVLGTPLDADGGSRVVSARVRVSRNLRDFRMPSACSAEERSAVESALVEALSSMTGDLEGEYFPLLGSQSYTPKPDGMSEEEEDALRASELLFEEPDSAVLISSGFARDWPDARGLFVDRPHTLSACVNEFDHLRLGVTDRDASPDLKRAFERLSRCSKSVEASLAAKGHAFAMDERLGFLGSDPSMLGSCLVASVALRIPLLSAQPGFRELCQRLQLQAQLTAPGAGLSPHEGIWEVQNSIRLGSTEVEQVNMVIEACQSLLAMEARLEKGEKLDIDATADDDVLPGLGDEEYPGFPVETCPQEMPNLQRHHSLMADVLVADPDIYTKLKDVRTDLGVSLARCIKCGVDNQGHRLCKTVGVTAGDAQCYDVFRLLFDPIISARHRKPQSELDSSVLVRSLKSEDISSLPLDETGKMVLSVKVSIARNLAGHRFTPAMSLAERRKVEESLSKALAKLQGGFAGKYCPLTGSRSAPRLGSMLPEEEAHFRSEDLLFEAPDAPIILASGRARHWPQARGVFANEGKELAALVNDEDHLNLVFRRYDADLKAAFISLCQAEEELAQALVEDGQSFARSDRLGFLTTCPSNLGTALRAKVRLHLPRLGQLPGFRELTWALGVQATRVLSGEDLSEVWDISNAMRLGSTEVEQVNAVAAAVRALVAMEQKLLAGQVLDLKSEVAQLRSPAKGKRKAEAMPFDFKELPGLGEDEVPGFPVDECPEQMPDLTGYCSGMVQKLIEDPSLYERLRGLKTSMGVTFAKCIKPGMDNKGHKMIRTVGAFAGDAESYSLFRDLLVPLASASKTGQAACYPPGGLDTAGVISEAIDPLGGHVVAARVKVSRNLKNFCFPPALSREARQQVEQIVVKALMQLDGDMAGKYLPLQFSGSYEAMPQGMTEKESDELASRGLLFEAPNSKLVLSSGSGRHWPEARGVFESASRSLAAWVNEEDHLRLTATGSGLQEAFAGLCSAEGAVRSRLQKEGVDFAFEEGLGFLTSDPSKLGSGGLQASVMLKLPSRRGQADFKARCRELHVSSRPLQTETGTLVTKIFAAAKPGQSEKDLLEQVAAAARQLIAEEVQLAAGNST